MTMTIHMTRPGLRSRAGVLALLIAIAGIVLTPAGAGADTIDTFSFTQDGWYDSNQDELPLVQLSGTFTARVDATGQLQLSDLTAFSAIAVFGPFPIVTTALNQVSFFRMPRPEAPAA
jgi:hypothetical protein